MTNIGDDLQEHRNVVNGQERERELTLVGMILVCVSALI